MSISSVFLRPPVIFYNVVLHMIIQALNGRNIFRLVFNFFINFSPVFIWLCIFKNASIIPNEIRPPIHVRLAKNFDLFMFDVARLSSWLSFLLLCGVSYLMWFIFYKIDNDKIFKDDLMLLKQELFVSDLENQGDNVYELEDTSGNSSNNKNSPASSLSSSSQSSSSQSSSSQFSSNQEQQLLEQQSPISSDNNLLTYVPKSCVSYAPPLLLATSWIILNIDHTLINHQTTPLDLIAWTSYVLFHFFSPLFTSIYLYVFQTPGAIKWFSCALGCQNIAGVLTHLLFPNAPPWFIHLYGEDASADYDMPGYAAGLTRVDVALGTHLNSKGFHKSPIVFGALPSIHSAMAVQSFFFVCWYTNWYWPKVGMFMFVVLQWWATMYLDHHWRLDLIVGLVYAVISFTFFKKYLLRAEEKFVKARLKGDFANGSTYGMRVFKNYWLTRLFDPYQ